MKKYIILIMISVSMLGCSFNKNGNDPRRHDIEIFKDTPVWDLAKAVKKQNINKITKFIENNKGLINYKENKFDNTLLIWAIFNDKYQSAKKLLELGADPNIISKDIGGSILFPVLHNDDIKYAKLLLAYKANPNAMYCITNKKEGVTEYYECGTSPLIYVISPLNSRVDWVKMLVNYGADVNHKTKLGRTASIEALTLKDIESAYFLIVEKKANIKDPYYYDSLPEFKNKPYYAVDILLYLTYPLDSDEYKIKMAIVKEFTRQGVNYNERKKNITNSTLNLIQKLYPENWDEYLEKY